MKFDHISIEQSWNVDNLCLDTSNLMAHPSYHIMTEYVGVTE